MIVDSHCHLVRIKDYKLKKDLLPVTVGYSHNSNVKTVEIAKKLKIPFVLGIAPQTAIKEDISKLDEWVDFIRKNKPNAIGEIGLDYHWAQNDQDIEKEKVVYTRMMDLAEEMKLPVVLHTRKATSEVLDFLSTRNFKNGFMLHFFSGTLGQAKRAVEIGGLISIPPLHSKDRKIVINTLELKSMLVESDAPYVVRLPEDTKKAVSYISEVKNISEDEVAAQTTENAKKFFKIG